VSTTPKLLIATPMFGGLCGGYFTTSCLMLQRECIKREIPVEFYFVLKQGLISIARNECAHYFLKGDYTHLVFIDGDQKFKPEDIFELIDADKDIVAGVVPVKTINWDAIYKVASDKRVKNGNELETYSGRFGLRIMPGQNMMDVKTPLRVYATGTGLMAIKRSVFDILIESYPEIKFRHSGWADSHRGETSYAFFDCGLIQPDENFVGPGGWQFDRDGNDKEYVGEDYKFCYLAHKQGIEIWVLPWVCLQHFGHYEFKGIYRPGFYG